jgi:hypothetical protein
MMSGFQHDSRVVLASRKNAGIHVTLLWTTDTNAVAVVVRMRPTTPAVGPRLATRTGVSADASAAARRNHRSDDDDDERRREA